MTLPDKIRGWNYSSAYTGASSVDPWYQEDAQLDYDLADMKAAGINTVKIYATESNTESHLAGLDKVLAAGLNAIVVRFITYGTDYSVATGDANRTAAIAKLTGMVDNLKGHEAIIGWGFANENNVNLNGTPEAEWYSLVDAAITAAKLIDDTRWYTTIDADLGTYPGDVGLTSLDVLGLNIYRGQTLTDLVTDIGVATGKPVLITEFGIEKTVDTDAWHDVQGRQIQNLIKEIEDAYPTIVGWVHFKFTDSVVDDFWEVTGELEQGASVSRTKQTGYNRIKDYCTTYAYGDGEKLMLVDRFETGDFSAWSSTVTDSGDLAVTEAAAINGTYGMAVLIDGTGAIYAQDDTPTGLTTYRAGFYIDPNGLTMADNDEFNVFRAVKEADTTCFIVALKYTTVGGYFIRALDRTDAGNFSKATSDYAITDAPHRVDVYWTASTGVGANNGTMALYIDGVFKQTVTAIDSDTEVVDFVRLGATQNIDVGTSGTFYIDDFESAIYVRKVESVAQIASRLAGFTKEVSTQEAIATHLGILPVTKFSVQEMLAGLAGLSAGVKSSQEIVFDNIKTACSLSNPYTQYSEQLLWTLASNQGLTLDQVIGND